MLSAPNGIGWVVESFVDIARSRRGPTSPTFRKIYFLFLWRDIQSANSAICKSSQYYIVDVCPLTKIWRQIAVSPRGTHWFLKVLEFKSCKFKALKSNGIGLIGFGNFFGGEVEGNGRLLIELFAILLIINDEVQSWLNCQMCVFKSYFADVFIISAVLCIVDGSWQSCDCSLWKFLKHTLNLVVGVKWEPRLHVMACRYESNSGGEREIQRTMLELLNQLDGFDSKGDVKVW